MSRYSWIQTLKKLLFRRSRSRFWKAECRGLFIRVRTPDQGSEPPTLMSDIKQSNIDNDIASTDPLKLHERNFADERAPG